MKTVALRSVGSGRHYVDSKLPLEEIGNLAYMANKRVAFDEDFRVFLCSEEEYEEILAYRKQEAAFNIQLLKLFDELVEAIHEREMPKLKARSLKTYMSLGWTTWGAENDPKTTTYPKLTDYLKDVVFEVDAETKVGFQKILNYLRTSRGRDTVIRSYMTARDPIETAKCLVEYMEQPIL